ncbi:hypothetical protein LZ30DRAFT_721592 [Colletotrichum cereale]|nr:hypothetical protein LZ30DRAFT_721592 [Colletotrichum cereale]
MRPARRSKKQIQAGSIPGLMDISSLGSIASDMRASLLETQLRSKELESSSGAQ